MLKRAALLAMSASLSACSTIPPYVSYSGKDAACISGGMANVVKFFSSGEAHTFVREIDGVPSSGSGPFCVAPGSHRLGIRAAAQGYQQAQGYVEVQFQPGTTYELRGQLVGISIQLSVVALIAGGAEEEVAHFSMVAGSSGQQTFTPIFIPAKK